MSRGWAATIAIGIGVCISADMPAHAACPTGSTHIRPPSPDINAIVSTAPEGTTFCIHAGVYRMQAIIPKKNQRFYGLPGAILNGARLIKKFQRSEAFWVATRQTQEGFRHAGEECLPEMPRCDRPEAFFIDDQPLLAVAHKRDVVPGKFYFDYDADRIYFLDDPTGKTVEASVSPYAFCGGAPGVIIEGLIVEKYSAPIQSGAVGANVPSHRWIVRNNEIRLNYALGVTIGTKSQVLNNHIHDNGEMGIGCVGDDILIEANEIARNGTFSGLDPFWEGGGGKCALTDGLIVRGNYSHDNNGPGFWTDIDNINSLYENNRIEDNATAGISHEISYAAVIRNNTFKGNGHAFHVWLWGGAIQIQNSRDVEVYGNTVDTTGAGNGITLIQQNRGNGRYGPHDTVNNNVHDNQMTNLSGDGGSWGAIADYGAAIIRNGNNRIDYNVYTVTSGADDHWAWINGFYSWDDYRNKSGQDANSTLVIAP